MSDTARADVLGAPGYDARSTPEVPAEVVATTAPGPAEIAAGRSAVPEWSWAWAGPRAAAVVVPAVFTVLDVTCHVRLTQLLLVGPCIAAVTSRARTVALNVVYVLILMTYLAWPNHTAGTIQQVFTTVAGVGIGAVCVVASARRQSLERSVVREEWRRTVLAGIVESTVEAVVGCRLDGTITEWNAAAERLYGYPADAAVGRSIRMLYPAEPEPSLREIHDRVVAG